MNDITELGVERASVIQDRYEVLELAGQGGAGYVYKVRDRENGQLRALKVLVRTGDVSRRRFRREFLATSRLRHPHIVAVHDMFESEGRLCYTMEFVEGQPLDEWVGRDGDLNDPARLQRLQDALAQVLEALTFIHGHQIVHRDLKPENILAETGGQVKLMDFGLIRTRTESWASLTGENIVGTLHYISPEQLDSRSIDARSDLYSLGAILYELLTGHPPHERESVPGLLTAILREEPAPVRSLNAAADPFLESVAMTLLAKDPAQRFQSAEELADVVARRSMRPGSGPVQAVTADEAPASASVLYRPQLVGRDDELKVLRDALAAARDGRGAVVFVAGESGSGKTRLLQELDTLARGAGARFLLARGQAETTRAYGALTQTFEELAAALARRPRSETDSLIASEGRALLELSPTFEQIPAVAELPSLDHLSDQEREWRVGAAAAELLRGLTRTKPVVLAAEDLHEWDRLSLKLLHHLIRCVVHPDREDAGEDPAPLIVVGTYREDDLQNNKKLDRLLSTLKRRQLAKWLGLRCLTRTEVETVVASMLGGTKRLAGLSEWIYLETEGQPHFVVETVEMLVHEGYLVRPRGFWRIDWRKLRKPERSEISTDDLAGIPLALSVRELLARRVDRLDPTEREVLETAAIVGPDFEFEVLRLALEMDEDDLLDILDGLLKARLLVARDAREDILSFDHAKLRDVILSGVPATRERDLHARVAQALEQHYSRRIDEHVVRLAHHYSEAGNIEKALDYLPEAGQRLAAVRFEDGIRSCENYLTLYQELSETARSPRMQAALDIRRLHARLLRSTGQTQRALEIYDQLLAQLGPRGELDRVAEILVDVAIVQEQRGQNDAAAHLARRALRIAQSVDARRAEASALQRLGTISANRGQNQDAIEQYEKALAILRELDHERGVDNILTDLANVHFNMGGFDRALEYHKEALNASRRSGDTADIANCLNNIGNVDFMLGRFDAALSNQTDALAIRRRIGDRSRLPHSHANIGAILLALGDIAEAREHIELSLDMSREVEDQRLTIINLINLGYVCTTTQQYEKAREELETALALSRQTGIRLYEPEIHLQSAKAAGESGQPREARAQAHKAVELARELGNRAAEAVGTVMLAELSEGDEARSFAEAALHLARSVNDGTLILKSWYQLGRACQQANDARQTELAFAEARKLLSQLVENAGERGESFLSSPGVKEIASALRSQTPSDTPRSDTLEECCPAKSR